MQQPTFHRLNVDWNADPNVPSAEVQATGSEVQLRFFLNASAYEADEDEVGLLTFRNCRAWRFGGTNDEGWYRGQCRYSASAPAWGEFYELLGEDGVRNQPLDWNVPTPPGSGDRHFLFYLRDGTFECFAATWTFERGAAFA